MKVKRLLLYISILFSFFSCQDYESEEYKIMENEALSDIILEMINFEKIESLNGWGNDKLKLNIVNILDTTTAWTEEPRGFITAINKIELPKEKIEENKKEYEKHLSDYNSEKELFKNLKNGKISSRHLKYIFSNDKIEVQLIDPDEIKGYKVKDNELGYLSISRIVFNRNFTIGYLHYDFYCGYGCAWDNNIEIKKVKGKWKITDYYSGGIA